MLSTKIQNIISLTAHFIAYCISFTASVIIFAQYFNGSIVPAIWFSAGLRYFRSRQFALDCSKSLPQGWRMLYLSSYMSMGLEGFLLLHYVGLPNIDLLKLSIALGSFQGNFIGIALLSGLGIKPIKRSMLRQFFGVAQTIKPMEYQVDDNVRPHLQQPELGSIDNSDYQEIDLEAIDRTTIDPDLIRNLLGDSMKSTFFCGIQGSGKGFLVSLLAAEARRQGHKIFLLDPKGDDDERSLWDGAINRVFRFVGRKEESPETYVDKIKGAIKAYSEYAESNGKTKYTILIFDEFSSAAGKFAQTKNDKLWLVNEIEDLVKLGDAAGICLWLVAQTPHCKHGIDGSLLSSLRRIIIASEDNLAQLQNWTNTTFMTGINLDDCAMMCQASPVNRAVYNSVTRDWYAMPRLRQGETYFDRDSRQMVGELN
jgi:hypothetical protein